MSLEVDVEHAQGAFRLAAAFRSDGRLTALFGRSGSGKTTLVNTIGGLVRPERGRIVVDGIVLFDAETGVFTPKHRRRIGYVFQEGRLFPHLSVRHNLLFGRWFSRSLEHENADRGFEAIVRLLGIGDLLSRRPASLSGGEKQRVAIGRALLARPRLLLMDEPLAALDEARKSEILPYIERLRDEAGVPIVYVSHSVAEVSHLADTVVVLERGRVAAVGPATTILGERLGVASLVENAEGGTVLEGRVAAHDVPFGLTTLTTPAGDLEVPRFERPLGSPVRALVRARDVMLCLERPRGISALNVLPGVVEEVGQGQGAWCEVRLRCHAGATLIARVTRKSVADLDLSPGRPVFALVKSVSFDTQ